MTNHSRLFFYLKKYYLGLLQPPTKLLAEQSGVWALAISLAATEAIVITLFSSPYLDVSVQEVPPAAVNTPINRRFGHGVSSKAGWVSPLGNRRIKAS